MLWFRKQKLLNCLMRATMAHHVYLSSLFCRNFNDFGKEPFGIKHPSKLSSTDRSDGNSNRELLDCRLLSK
jgi:hypothetical protein